MKKLLKIVIAVAVIGTGAFAATLMLTKGARETAHEFVMLTTNGALEEAYGMLHSAVRQEISLEQFSQTFGGTKPYVEVNFSAFSTSGEITELEGTASTADGCMSKVDFELVGDQIVSANITPLCR